MACMLLLLHVIYKHTLQEREHKSTHTITRQTNRNPLLYGAYLVALFSVKTHYQESSHIPVTLLIITSRAPRLTRPLVFITNYYYSVALNNTG